MKTYTLEPQDLLFFRDGRPIETGGGHGARWPEPSVIFDALHAALWRAFPDDQRQNWEHRHDFGRSSHRPRNGNTQRFGSLATAGLFPVWTDGRWLFPAPADVAPSDIERGWLLSPRPLQGTTNLPASFLRYTVASLAKPTKDTIPPWWSAAAWQDYLAGRKPARAELFTPEDLFAGEWTTGIGIDPDTQTQDGQRLYSAEYLRLQPNVRCGFTASLRMKQNGNSRDMRECIEQLFIANDTIIVGGQQRACRVAEVKNQDRPPLPMGATITGTRVKWVLLSPAIWPAIPASEAQRIAAHPGGWLPNWIAPHDGYLVLMGAKQVTVQGGQVLLKAEAPRGEGECREAWRERIRKADFIGARLVAACVPKPVPITGWTERLHLLKDEAHWGQDGGAHGPRQFHHAVPAGAVYYFEADSSEAARKLADALNWHGSANSQNQNSEFRIQKSPITNRRSTLLGEKGFGLGVCGTWDLDPEPSTT